MFTSLQNPLALASRLLLAALFLPAGIGKITGFAGTVGYISSVGLPMPTVAAGTTEHMTLILTNDATAGRAVTITGIQWVGGTAPTFDTAASAKNIIVLRGINGAWIGDGGKFA